MPEDARYRTKVLLEDATKGLNNANLTKDDDGTEVSFIVCFGNPPYPITRVFLDCDVDLVFTIAEPTSEPILDTDQTPSHYKERVPIFTFCIDKPGITGTKLKWKAEADLRRINETYPTGSQRAHEERRDNDQRLGPIILYSTKYVLSYVRDTT